MEPLNMSTGTLPQTGQAPGTLAKVKRGGPNLRMLKTFNGTPLTRNGPTDGSVNSPSGGESWLSREWSIFTLRLLVVK